MRVTLKTKNWPTWLPRIIRKEFFRKSPFSSSIRQSSQTSGDFHPVKIASQAFLKVKQQIRTESVCVMQIRRRAILQLHLGRSIHRGKKKPRLSPGTSYGPKTLTLPTKTLVRKTQVTVESRIYDPTTPNCLLQKAMWKCQTSSKATSARWAAVPPSLWRVVLLICKTLWAAGPTLTLMPRARRKRNPQL